MTDKAVGKASSGDPVVLITGASAGIGEACARLFHAEGYRVAACSNDPVPGFKLGEELNGQRAASGYFFECDVREPEQIADFVEATVREFGRIDVVINNVGIPSLARTLDEHPVDEIRDYLDVNLLSYLLVTRSALPHVRRAGGSIVNIGSISASIGGDRMAVYCATKGAIAAFSRALAIDEVHFGVRVNTVLPGNIMTASRQRLEDALPDPTELHDFIESWQWMGRSGAPAEVAQTCLFLAGDKASFITGTEIVVSGGVELGFGPKYRTTVQDGHVIRIPLGGSTAQE
jgi:NAD(P)-dependent dehydrogenase (short-subunit alcohol dehydrogenase family)